MVDKEKVLKGLECCSKSISNACPMECPYRVECLMQDDKLYMYSVMHDALELMKEPPQWISVEDKLPDKSNRYLVYFGKGIGTTMKTAYWLRTKQKWMGSEAHSTITDITHWMPLPEPPKEEKQ